MAGQRPARRPSFRGRRASRPTGDDRELAILATAERLLEHESLSAISIDDLARGAGISRPTFYFYFPSKDAVLLTLLDRVVAEADAASARAFADPSADRRTCWRDGITAYYETFRKHRGVSRAAAEARTTSPEVRKLWARVFEGWVQNCTATIQAERHRGAAPPGPPARELAIALNSMNERVLAGTRSGDGPAIPQEQVVDVLLEIWLRAIYGTGAPAPRRRVD
jgi:TetR/AcrR family transcriptional regulator, ethionamide resistance regulator